MKERIHMNEVGRHIPVHEGTHLGWKIFTEVAHLKIQGKSDPRHF